ncbi:hypothetical protein [Amycolatopsis magusensis]|uniref:hypothetical protein n=1 Tax=Amycolatopsis magusensis TaxID=882444 RepID=UPI0037A74A1D
MTVIPTDGSPESALIRDVVEIAADCMNFRVEVGDPDTRALIPDKLQAFGDRLLELGRRCHEVAGPQASEQPITMPLVDHPSEPPDEDALEDVARLLHEEIDGLIRQHHTLAAASPDVGVRGSLATYLAESTEPDLLAALLATTIERLAKGPE